MANLQVDKGTPTRAIERTETTSVYLHSDQGSEYDAKIYEEFVFGKDISMSMSKKHSPWENAFQESFIHSSKTLDYSSYFSSVFCKPC